MVPTLHPKTAKPVIVGLMVAAGLAVRGTSAADFALHVRPILADRCFVCHGPDAEQRQGDLRLDREGDAKEHAIVSGAADESPLYQRITAEDPRERMPPPESKLHLSPEEIAVLREWIDGGAPWRGHWSFESPERPALPEPKNVSWCRNEIDQFIVHQLETRGLPPAPAAAGPVLLRRLFFDLTGLPPSPEDLEEWLPSSPASAAGAVALGFAASGDEHGWAASPRFTGAPPRRQASMERMPSEVAYEQLVDRLLESEAFAERMASVWLDAARYSDTFGYQVDRDRFVWPWRDWVVRAFRDNMPYDQFVTLQLAGDLLPGPLTQDQARDSALATTFQRLHPQKVEGGSDPEEFRVEYVADRTQTFSTVVLGLTMECCRCHDHKYDPLTQRDYYHLSAFFDNIDEAGLYSYFTDAVPTPTLWLTDAETELQLAAAEREVAEAEAAREGLKGTRQAAWQEWLTGAPSAELPGRVAFLDFEGAAVDGCEMVAGPVGQAVRLSGDQGIALSVGNFRRYDPFSVALWLQTPDEKERAVVFHRSRAWTDAGSRGYELLIEEGRLSAALIHFWPGNALRIVTREKLPVGRWSHLVMTYDGSSRASGLRLYLNGQAVETEVVRDQLRKNITGGGGDQITIGERFRDRGFTQGMVDEFQVFARELTALEAAHLHDGESLHRALGSRATNGGGVLHQPLFDYYLSAHDSEWQRLAELLRAARAELCQLQDGVREIMAMKELPTPRTTYFLHRGAFDQRGDAVSARTPAALPPFPQDQPRNRLGLVRWATHPAHPLTARVAVNRFWQMIFGAGLVRTPEDFGLQGAPPTHPELLDWLARDFVDSGWDIRRLLKRMVLSSTYRQASTVTDEQMSRDPENHAWGRALTFRLPAEMLRDNALAVSGLLVRRVGGPPVKPYDIEQAFQPSARDSGEGLYRRSLYTYWKRNGPSPAMMVLDAAKRDVCQVRREHTASPLQAFVMMNGTQFVEAARVTGERLLREFIGTDREDEMLRRLFVLSTSRQAREDELHLLRQLLESQRQHFLRHPDQAASLLQVGDAPGEETEPEQLPQLAALTCVVNIMLNHDECVRRH